MLKLDCEIDYTTNENTKNYYTIYLQWMNFIVCKLYLKKVILEEEKEKREKVGVEERKDQGGDT